MCTSTSSHHSEDEMKNCNTTNDDTTNDNGFNAENSHLGIGIQFNSWLQMGAHCSSSSMHCVHAHRAHTYHSFHLQSISHKTKWRRRGKSNVLTSIWECPMLNKTIAINNNGKSYYGLTCGWCPPPNDGAKAKWFRSINQINALLHVAKIAGFDFRPCLGYIPPAKSRQHRALYHIKAVAKELR